MARTPEELPDEHRLCYPDELKGSFRRSDDHEFSCIKSSSEEPKIHKDEIDNNE